VIICEIIVHLLVIVWNKPTCFTFLQPEFYCQILKLWHVTCHFFKHWDDASAICKYSGITSKKSPSFCVTTFGASLKSITALLLQSHDCFCYLSRRKLKHLQFWVAERIWCTRTLPTCDIGLDSPKFPAPEAGDFFGINPAILCTSYGSKVLKLRVRLKWLRLNPVFTGTNYLWLTTQSVVSNTMEAPREFPVGMLGKWQALRLTISDQVIHALVRRIRV